MNSADNERVVNNVMRHEYRVLTDVEKVQMKAIKDKGLELLNLLHEVGGTASVQGAPFASRELSIAGTKTEEAVMWAVKHLTK